MTTHAESAAEAELPPLTSGPHRQRIGLISVIACLGGLLFGYDTGVANGAEGPMAKELGLSLLQLGVVISALLFAAAIGALVGGIISDKIGRRKTILILALLFFFGVAAGRVLPGRTRGGHLLPAGLRGPGGRPHRARARGRWRIDGGPGLPRGAGAVRDPRLDHRAQRVGHRRRPAVRIRGERDPRRDPRPRGRRLAHHVRGLRAAGRRAVLRHAADAGVAALAGGEGQERRSARGAEDRAFRGPGRGGDRSGRAGRPARAGEPTRSGSARSWAASGCGASSSSASVCA